jgi:hypothetical protein
MRRNAILLVLSLALLAACRPNPLPEPEPAPQPDPERPIDPQSTSPDVQERLIGV